MTTAPGARPPAARLTTRPVGGRPPACLLAACLLSASVLGACTLGPDFVRPAVPVVSAYTREPLPSTTVAAGSGAQHLQAGVAVPDRWWQLFGSPALDEVLRIALDNNANLQLAQANLRQAQDLLLAGQGLFAPQLEGNAGISRARSAPAGQGTVQGGTVYTLVTASGTVGYAFDVFGAQARAVEGLGAQRDQQAFLVQATYLTLTANVVNACIAHAAYGAQLDATRELLALQQAQLDNLMVRVQAGTAAWSTVLAQRSAMAATRTQLAPLALRRTQAAHLLALLQGQLPADAPAPDIALTALQLPRDVPLDVPSRLVRQRPDILAAEAGLHAASAAIGVATAARFPAFTLTAAFGEAATALGRLATSGSPFWSVSPAVTAPLFNGGTLHARQQASMDAYAAQQAAYRQTVLTAFSQVADTLQALQADAQLLQANEDAQTAAGHALAVLQSGYQAGLGDWLDVMGADVQLQQARLGTLQATAQRQQDTVALLVALGGGWRAAP